MSNEIKQGDKVRVSKDAPWLYVGGLDRIFAISDSVVTAIENDNAAIKCYHGQAARILIIPTKYLVKVDADAKEARHIFYGDYAIMASESLEELKRKAYPEWYSSTEPTEQTEAEEEPCAGRINFAERIKRQQEAHQAIVDEFSSRSFDWDAYTADLAKELAIAYGKRGKSPLDAVAAAKEITKRLKQK